MKRVMETATRAGAWCIYQEQLRSRIVERVPGVLGWTLSTASLQLAIARSLHPLPS